MTADDYAERIREGERLARRVGDTATHDRLVQLLLDPSNTAVTYRTALALLARRDDAGVELVVRANARADDNTSQWLGDAFLRFRAASLGEDDAFLRQSLGDFLAAPDEELRAGAQDIIDWLDL